MRFDVLIVGAGPAGCAAAIRAASRGLRVAMVEQAAYPRDLPGEALHPQVDDLFAELGVSEAIAAAGFIRCPGWIREREGERSFVAFDGPGGLRFGYQAWRAELDSILLARARSAGVTVAQPAKIHRPLVEGEEIAGVEVNGESWMCRHSVDASGASGWLARVLRLPGIEFSPKLVARYAYFRGDRAIGVIPEFREHACGWTWLARVKNKCCQCVQLSLDTRTKSDALPLPDCVPGHTRFRGVRFRGAKVTWRLTPECAGAGYFLCGDAAGVLDPAASSGVARALASGLKAADLILEIEKNKINRETAAAMYRRWYAELFVEQARELASRYADLDAPPAWIGTLEDRWSALSSGTRPDNHGRKLQTSAADAR